jgi:uncharacterized membrane-anchored protein YitT (DUF2179 family)
MNGVMAYLYRFIVVIGGYIAACLAASAFLNIVILGSSGLAAEDMPFVATGSFIFSIPFVALLVAYFAFVPSVLAILASEVLGKRDWLFHAIAGGIVAAVLTGFFRRSTEAGNEAAVDLTVVLVMIAAGMCGGIGYWLIAGRTAGSWRQRQRDVTSSAP